MGYARKSLISLSDTPNRCLSTAGRDLDQLSTAGRDLDQLSVLTSIFAMTSARTQRWPANVPDKAGIH
jgi:hypothetical protein